MAIKTFTEAARGRKKCPANGCPHYVAAVTKKCPCGHEFVSGKKPKPVATKVAAKLATAAGTQKPKRKPKPKPEPEPEIEQEQILYGRDRRGVGLQRTAIPAGACPAKLKSTDQAAVYEWIEKVCKAKEDDRNVLMASALKYYAREFYECVGKTNDYNIVCDHIESYWLSGGVNPPDEYEVDDDDESDEVTETEKEETEEEDFDWDDE
jgi:hypothetical protein